MASAIQLLEGPIPRPLLWIGTPIAGFCLVVLFVFLGFPYEMLAGSLAARLSDASGNEVYIRDLEPRITLAGPGMSLRHVEVTTPQNARYAFDPISIRPAWSTSWLSLEPAVYIDLGSPYGDASGTVVVAENASFDGGFSNVDLERLPASLPGGVELTGIIDADADLTLSSDGPIGELTLQARSGMIVHPNLPIPLEFDSLTAHIEMGRQHWLDVHQFALDGPILSSRVTGHIEAGRGNNQPLDLAVGIEIKTPPMQAMLRGFGVALDGEGRADFKVGGTVASPKMR